MSRRKRPPSQIDLRAILESPVGRLGKSGKQICAYEAAMRRAAENASNGKMSDAKRFVRELEAYGLLTVSQAIDDHQFVIRVPKEWDDQTWRAMFDHYGSPPWPGEHDGLVPAERWEMNYGRIPRPVRRARRRKQ